MSISLHPIFSWNLLRSFMHKHINFRFKSCYTVPIGLNLNLIRKVVWAVQSTTVGIIFYIATLWLCAKAAHTVWRHLDNVILTKNMVRTWVLLGWLHNLSRFLSVNRFSRCTKKHGEMKRENAFRCLIQTLLFVFSYCRPSGYTLFSTFILQPFF